MTAGSAACPLCQEAGGELVWQGADHRVILADEPRHPGFCRVIWGAHVREMSDLAPADAARLFATVLRVEGVLREQLAPDKVNLASLGNVVPHLHWHVIPRWTDDSHFPDPVWAVARREVPPRAIDRTVLLAALRRALGGARGGEGAAPI
ncbi:MAG: HIT family protein [Rhodocyclaceae bacterium]|nr:HIT family protein [Rhodocyclaceae bacterium]